MIFQCSVSGVIYYIVFSFCRLLFQLHVFWQYSIISKSVKYVATSTYHRDLIYSPPRNPRVGSKSPTLFVKKPLCTGDLSPARKIFIERPVGYHSMKFRNFPNISFASFAFYFLVRPNFVKNSHIQARIFFISLKTILNQT